MPQIEPANIIVERLKSIALPPLVRPPVGPYDEATEELVIWAVHNYAYSSIAHYRTILDGLMVLAAIGNEPTMFLVYRHLYEWTMHGCYMLQNFKQHLDNGDLKSAWELFLQADTANGWVKLHGAKYAPEISNNDIPNTLRIKRFVAAYEKHQRDRGGTAHVQDDYGYLNEHSHPNGACLIPYRIITGSQLSFREPPANHTIKGVAHAAATDWLLTIYNLLEVSKERHVCRPPMRGVCLRRVKCAYIVIQHGFRELCENR